MKVNRVRLLRKALVALILIVMGAIVFNYVQTWRRRARVVSQTAKILSTDMLRSADALEYSELENGVMHFKLRAEKLLETRKGINLLEGIDAYDYNPDGSPRNHIRSRRAEYDREQRKAFFFGDVQIQASGNTELRTDSLHYDLSANSGNTDDPVAVSSRQARGSARGARYDHTQGILELQSDLDFVVQHTARGRDSQPRKGNMRIRSDHGFYSESARTFKFQGDTRIESENASLSGEQVEVSFSPDKKRITALYCSGNAVYISKDAEGVRTLRGERMVFGINPSSRSLERIDVLRDANFSMTSQASNQFMSGEELHVALDPISGSPNSLECSGAVKFKSGSSGVNSTIEGQRLAATFKAGTGLLDAMRVWGNVKMSSQPGSDAVSDSLAAGEIRLNFGTLNGRNTLAGLEADQSVTWISTPPSAAQGKRAQPGRVLSCSRLRMTYSASGEYLESGQATGGVSLAGIPLGESSQTEIRRLRADSARFRFFPRDNKLRSFEAEDRVEAFYRNTSPEAEAKTAQEFRTTSSRMRATFRENDGTAEAVQQTGNFVYQDGSRTASSDTGDYDAGKEVLLLRGSPRIVDETATTNGDVVQYDRTSKVLNVRGHVRSVLRPRDTDQTPFSSTSGSPSPSVVTADAMEYWSNASRVRYSGDVQMLSETSQLSARSLELKDDGSQIIAEGDIRHLLVRTQDEVKPGGGNRRPPTGLVSESRSSSKTSPILVRSSSLRYVKAQNSIHYQENVTLQSDDTWMHSDTLDALISADGKNFERVAARGGLHLKQAGREVKGQDGDYYLDPGKFVVTGNPAEIRDPLKGSSSARRLTFFTADDRILLGP